MPLTLKQKLGHLGIRLHKKLAIGHVIELEYISQNSLWGGGYNHNTHERGFFPMLMLFIPSTAADRSKRPTNFILELTAGKFLYFPQHALQILVTCTTRFTLLTPFFCNSPNHLHQILNLKCFMDLIAPIFQGLMNHPLRPHLIQLRCQYYLIQDIILISPNR